MPRDEYYRDSRDLVDFAFDERVAAVFPDMIRRSVPGYETVLPLAGLMAARHLRAGGRCYDLGCSLGASARAVLRNVRDTDVRVIAVDNSEAMLSEARRLNADEPRIEFLEADVRDLELQSADAVLLNYTLQFVPPEDRRALLTRIRRALSPTGILIVCEKIRFSEEARQDHYEALHSEFKRANGYSDLEIASKRTALENVMRPDTEATHLARFAEAGFAHTDTWFRCLNWAAFAARP